MMPSFVVRCAGHAALILGLVFAFMAPAHATCNRQNPFAASPSDSRTALLQQVLDAYRARNQRTDGFSGVSLHVSMSAGGPVFDVASGSTSFHDGRSICPGTLFEIGSITKSFTAVLMLKLEAAGKLDIHQTLGQWLPQYPAWASITIQQMLNMTAPRTTEYVASKAYQKAVVADLHRSFTPEQLVGYAYPGTAASEPPWRYINTNYVLAAMIIEKAGGLSYADALRTRLFAPLGLHTAYDEPRVPPVSVLDAMASSYAEQSLCRSLAKVAPPCAEWPLDALLGHDVKMINQSSTLGDGGIIASLADVAHWVRALFGDTLLPPRQKAELFALVSQASGRSIAATSPTDPRGFALGLAQNWLPLTNGPLWAYQGETFGNEVLWGRRAGDPMIVVVAQNSATANNHLAALYETVLRILEPGKIIHPPATPGGRAGSRGSESGTESSAN
ncbi:MAG: serine hydrolase domain-containing protein [Acetobacteraceae bacterium]